MIGQIPGSLLVGVIKHTSPHFTFTSLCGIYPYLVLVGGTDVEILFWQDLKDNVARYRLQS